MKRKECNRRKIHSSEQQLDFRKREDNSKTKENLEYLNVESQKARRSSRFGVSFLRR